MKVEKASNKVRVADYIFQKLHSLGVKHTFMVTGGGAMHLNDAVGRCEGMNWVACHHEQACAMAAESYYRLSNRVAAVNVTSGPGGTNALTGIFGAWTDSLGVVVISGNVKFETTIKSTEIPLRQLGDQEVDIVKMATPITKYAVMVDDPSKVRYHVEKAFHLAKSGRPGPVWLDVPMNVQGAMIDPETQEAFTPEEEIDSSRPDVAELKEMCQLISQKMSAAERPVIMVGAGVRLSGAHSQFVELMDRLKVPVVTNWNSHDLIWDDHKNYVGRPGTVGDRAGNFVVQNSDFLLVLGSRLNIRQISYNWGSFAREAYKVMVDIDPTEMQKDTLDSFSLKIQADLKDFVPALLAADHTENRKHVDWLSWCKERKAKYPTVLPRYWDLENKVNPYCFTDSLFDALGENDVIVTGDGTACVVTFQAAKIKKGQRLYTNSGCAAMGYDLPAAVGAYFADTDFKNKRLVCLAGDGSMMMNLQELQTLVTNKIPVKLFVLNNGGYNSIRFTQNNYFPDNIIGCGDDSGLGFPNFEKLAMAFGVPYTRCENHKEMPSVLEKVVNSSGPQFCEVIVDKLQQFEPKVGSRKLPDGRMVSSPLEDMHPFLSREEFESNMIVPLYESENLPRAEESKSSPALIRTQSPQNH